MPTIDIPDKICPHCGGIKWRIEQYKTLKKGIVERHRCAKEHSERAKRWYNSHLDHVREYSARVIAEGINKTPEKREYYRNYSKKQTDELSENYVRKMLAYRLRKSEGISLEQKELPLELIATKQKQLLLTRQIRNNGKSN